MSEFKRQHPIASVTRLLAVIRQNFITLLIIFFIGSTRNGDFFWYALGFGLVSALVLGFFSWLRFSYRVFEGELQIKKGIFIRNNLYLSKERIQVIDITEGVVQRAFGLVKVEVKTAGSGTESATISAITRKEAEALREELRNKSLVEETGETVSGEEVQEEENETWRISKQDLFYAALTSGNFGLIASILGAVSGQMDQFINEENLAYLLSHLPGYSNVTVIIGVVLVILILSWLLSFLGVIIKYGDFKVEKKEKELLITSGLLERKHVTIPFDRIQAVRFVEGVIRQPFGYGMLYVESAGFDQNKKERSIVLVPYIAASRINEFLDKFLQDFDQPEFTIRPPRRSLFRYIRRPNYLLFLIIAGVWFFWDNGWILAAFAPFAAWLGWQRYRDAAMALGDDILRIRYRVLARTTALVRRKRIQNVECSRHPFQERRNLQTLKVMAASGAGGINFEIVDLSDQDCNKTYNWVIGNYENYSGPENTPAAYPRIAEEE